jgi:death-on-curing protein
MTQYLTAQEVLFIHARLIDSLGGEHGLRDVDALAAAVTRPQAMVKGNELYPDLYVKAAALMEDLVLNPPFRDGNRRTNIAAAALFLRGNGQRLTATNDELEHFSRYVADEWPPLNEIAIWFREHTTPAR